jgi:hypothetical protein
MHARVFGDVAGACAYLHTDRARVVKVLDELRAEVERDTQPI